MIITDEMFQKLSLYKNEMADTLPMPATLTRLKKELGISNVELGFCYDYSWVYFVAKESGVSVSIHYKIQSDGTMLLVPNMPNLDTDNGREEFTSKTAWAAAGLLTKVSKELLSGSIEDTLKPEIARLKNAQEIYSFHRKFTWNFDEIVKLREVYGKELDSKKILSDLWKKKYEDWDESLITRGYWNKTERRQIFKKSMAYYYELYQTLVEHEKKFEVTWILDEKDGEDIYAYFPNTIATPKGDKTCYAHLGQHSACHIEYFNECELHDTKSPEAQSLILELESLGYFPHILNTRVDD